MTIFRLGAPHLWTVEDTMLEDRESGVTVVLPVRDRIEFYLIDLLENKTELHHLHYTHIVSRNHGNVKQCK